MMRTAAILSIVSIVLAAGQTGPVLAQTERARTLHDTFCVGCHDTKVYTRKERLANDYAAVREQVDRWQTNVRLNWSEQDVDLVSAWLAERFYKVPCPATC